MWPESFLISTWSGAFKDTARSPFCWRTKLRPLHIFCGHKWRAMLLISKPSCGVLTGGGMSDADQWDLYELYRLEQSKHQYGGFSLRSSVSYPFPGWENRIFFSLGHAVRSGAWRGEKGNRRNTFSVLNVCFPLLLIEYLHHSIRSLVCERHRYNIIFTSVIEMSYSMTWYNTTWCNKLTWHGTK